MPVLHRMVLVCLTVAVFNGPAFAVIVELNNGKIYRGHLVEKNALRVVIRLDGKTDKVTFDMTKVKTVTRLIQEERLKVLKPGNWKPYYDYARELAVQTGDPEARDGALRLFLICAYHKPQERGPDCLMRMSSVTKNERDQRAFRAMSYLLDLVRDKSVLKKTSGALVDTKARSNFLKALELLRRGKTADALKYGKLDGVADFFDAIPGLMTYKEFQTLCAKHPECKKCVQGRFFCKACAGGKNKKVCNVCNGKGWIFCEKCAGLPRHVHLSVLQKEMIIRLQLLHEKNPTGPLDAPGTSAANWSNLLGPGQLRPVPVLSLLHLTEFDPRQSVFRRGKWVAPK